MRGRSGLQPPAGYGRLSTDENSGGGLPVMQKAQRHDEVPTAEQRLAAPPKRDRFPLQETRRAWRTLSAYERFEQVVALVLTVLIAAVILAAVAHLAFRIGLLLMLGLDGPVEQRVFQEVFGMIMTVLIALEFNHSLLGVLQREDNIVRVRTMILIALLALVRKFLLIDLGTTDPIMVLGLAAAVLGLGGVYLLVRGQDRRAARSVSDPRAPTRTEG